MLVMRLPKEKIINMVDWILGAPRLAGLTSRKARKNAGDKWKSLDHGSSRPQRPHHRYQGRCSQLTCHEDVEPLIKKAKATTAYLPRDVERNYD